jgi:exo-beta-1,3-glucanase (GH17 family)
MRHGLVFGRADGLATGLTCFAASVAVIAASWLWLGKPEPVSQSPLTSGEKLYCLSYAPFQGDQTPLDPRTMISAAQIEADLTQLAKITNCVRVYSTDYGLDQIAGIAQRHGLKVLQGLWLSSNPAKNKEQIDDAVRLARQYPDTIRAVVVGNEVLLRGDMSAQDLAATIRAVKSRVKVPVTYADVWEFWLRNPDVASAVDFITIHILPYWEDFPIPARNAAAHVASIRAQVAKAFAPKDVIIGEVGWPSEGRMREGALPSPANQARVIQDVLAWAAREKVRVNVIEAYDAPWKRALEGVVGGHWGLIGDASRQLKFQWGQPVSNHPQWKLQAAGGIAFAFVIFGAAFFARRDAPLPLWLAVSANASAGGVLISWALVNVPMESIGWGGWWRELTLAAVALSAPVTLSVATMRGVATPSLSRLIGPREQRSHDALPILVGIVMAATLLVGIVTTLGLVFDPRYRDFPFAPLTAAVVPFLTHSLVVPRPAGKRSAAELAGALLLALSVPYIALNEGMLNWQSLWYCGTLVGLIVSLVRVRDAQS